MRARYDLVIVGMGSGGMVASEFAARLGLKVAVVERHRVGGDCLWTGCVPSKALLASAKVAHHARTADAFGLRAVEPEIDLAEVWRRIRSIRERIAASDDDPARFSALGVEVCLGDATIAGPHEVRVDGRVLRTRFILLCTGSRPAEPDIPGLADTRFLTSESLFEIERPPQSIVMIGGGPIAIEMAQGMRRLGIEVVVLQKGDAILPRDEPELVSVLQNRLAAEGVALHLEVETAHVTSDAQRKTVFGTIDGAPMSWSAEEVLVAVGRKPNLESLGLESVGVETSPRGVVVDDRMRSTVPSIYVAGDAAGRYLFTHSAGHEAVRAVRDMFFPGRGRVSSLVPWCTFTDPELAHAGLTESEARERYGDVVRAHTFDLAHSDRARADGTEEALIKVVTGRRGRLLGAHVVAAAAGEMIHEYALAINEGLKFTRLANLIHVYPTLSSSTGQLAAEVVFDEVSRYRALVALWKRVPRR
ncbi:MAG TPA: FAD-dependent oxidoreductase [Acidimicrobiales bacterium]|nr:FAD-dependent oxidoreductase [Acidimicrobiales bacterium]